MNHVKTSDTRGCEVLAKKEATASVRQWTSQLFQKLTILRQRAFLFYVDH